MPFLTATHINYFHLCHRKLWLFSNGIRMEHTSGTVYEGKLLHESSYLQRAEKYTELEMEGIKIDYYDPHRKVVHEIKKSSSMESAHIAQVKYYLFVLERNGIIGATGILEYPKLRQTEQVLLEENDRIKIPEWERKIKEIITDEVCPSVINKKICKSCSYYEFCYVND